MSSWRHSHSLATIVTTASCTVRDKLTQKLSFDQFLSSIGSFRNSLSYHSYPSCSATRYANTRQFESLFNSRINSRCIVGGISPRNVSSSNFAIFNQIYPRNRSNDETLRSVEHEHDFPATVKLVESSFLILQIGGGNEETNTRDRDTRHT